MILRLLFPPRLANALARRLAPLAIRALDRFCTWWDGRAPSPPPAAGPPAPTDYASRTTDHTAALVIHVLGYGVDDYDATCCACGRRRAGRHRVYLLDRRLPGATAARDPETMTWGCFNCGLPRAGAMAVVCQACHRACRPVRHAISRARHGHGRLLITDLGARHVHRITHRRTLEALRN